MRTLFLSAAALLITAAGFAQEDGRAPLPPDHADAVVAYGGPVALTIDSGGEPLVFNVEVADTPRARTRGMMFRDSVAEDAGMLFLYDSPRVVSIWMKNTLVSLDILYVRADGMVAKIAHRAVPESLQSLSSEVPVLGVVEIAGGRAQALGLEPGDIVRHPAFESEAEGAGGP